MLSEQYIEKRRFNNLFFFLVFSVSFLLSTFFFLNLKGLSKLIFNEDILSTLIYGGIYLITALLYILILYYLTNLTMHLTPYITFLIILSMMSPIYEIETIVVSIPLFIATFIIHRVYIKNHVEHMAPHVKYGIAIFFKRILMNLLVIFSLCSVFFTLYASITTFYRYMDDLLFIVYILILFYIAIHSYIIYIYGSSITFVYLLEELGNSFTAFKNTVLSLGTAIYGSLIFPFIDSHLCYCYVDLAGRRFYFAGMFVALFYLLFSNYSKYCNRLNFLTIALKGKNHFESMKEGYELFEKTEITDKVRNSLFVTFIFAMIGIYILINIYEDFSIASKNGAFLGVVITYNIFLMIDSISKTILVLYETDIGLF